MRSANSRSRGGLPSQTAVKGVFAGLLVAAGVVATLALSGHLPFWRRPIDHTGMIPVPICARTIPPYTRVTREFLVNPATGEMAQYWFHPDKLPKGVITDVHSILGRVTARQKDVAYVFSEDNFLPEGTRPGMVAGVPPGKRAMTIDIGKLEGVFGLQVGDRFDLVATIPVDKLSSFGGADWNRVAVSVRPVAARDGNTKSQTNDARTLARDAVIVSPVTVRNKPIVSSTLMQGTSVRTVPVQEIVVAVAEDEVAAITKAVDLGVPITCVAESGRPPSQAAAAAAAQNVAVPLLVRDIPAFSELMEADFRDPVSQRTRFGSTSLAEVNRLGIIPNVTDLVGRVVRRRLLSGQAITDDDLLPPALRGGASPAPSKTTARRSASTPASLTGRKPCGPATAWTSWEGSTWARNVTRRKQKSLPTERSR